MSTLSPVSKTSLAVCKVHVIRKEKARVPPRIPRFQTSPDKEEIKELMRKEGKRPEDLVGKYNVGERTLYRYLAEVEQEKAGKVEAKPGGETTVTRPAQLAVVTTRAPGPIVFRMGDRVIDINPEYLYDAFRYCEDIKRIEPAIDDDFTLMLKIAAKHMWEFFSEREARRIGAKIEEKEENNGH